MSTGMYEGTTPNCDKLVIRTDLQTTKLWVSETAKLCTSESRSLATQRKDFQHTHTHMHACTDMQICPSLLHQKLQSSTEWISCPLISERQVRSVKPKRRSGLRNEMHKLKAFKTYPQKILCA